MSGLKFGTEVWTTIADVLAGPGPRCVAVPYIGIDAPELLIDLGPGDLLVCNASNSSLSQGTTYPSSLLEIYTRGVSVRSLPNLHAKVYTSGNRAFVGSANASASSIEKVEAGVVITAQAQVKALRRFVEDLASSREATRVDEAFLDMAEGQFRPPKGSRGGGDTTPHSWKLNVATFGDSAPATVTTAAESQRDQLEPEQPDLAATIDWSWGTPGMWRRGDVCLWIARSEGEPDTWLVDPPSVCLGGEAVGGRSRQLVYWWRTPALPPIPWAMLHRQVLLKTGRKLQMDKATSAAKVTSAVLEVYGLGPKKPSP